MGRSVPRYATLASCGFQFLPTNPSLPQVHSLASLTVQPASISGARNYNSNTFREDEGGPKKYSQGRPGNSGNWNRRPQDRREDSGRDGAPNRRNGFPQGNSADGSGAASQARGPRDMGANGLSRLPSMDGSTRPSNGRPWVPKEEYERRRAEQRAARNEQGYSGPRRDEFPRRDGQFRRDDGPRTDGALRMDDGQRRDNREMGNFRPRAGPGFPRNNKFDGSRRPDIDNIGSGQTLNRRTFENRQPAPRDRESQFYGARDAERQQSPKTRTPAPAGEDGDAIEFELDADFVEELPRAKTVREDVANKDRLAMKPERKDAPKKPRPASFAPRRTSPTKVDSDPDPILEVWDEALDEDDVDTIDFGGDRARHRRRRRTEAIRTPQKPVDVLVPDSITIANLAQAIGADPRRVLRKVAEMGLEGVAGVDHMLPSELASLVVLEFNMNPVVTSVAESDAFDVQPRPPPPSWSSYPVRPPVVTIMGHVDHGKTTLLDTLRKTAVAASEAGGITQHIGAFSVKLSPPESDPSAPPRTVTFLDTPGHAAFITMRRRGAQTTDIVVLVVAADDGVMPQTIEAIKHAKESNVPVIVAINKCDKPGAKPERVMEGLLREGIQVEEMGGDVPCVSVSGLKGTGLDELVETIATVAEIQLDVRGDPSGPVEAVVLESKVERGLGNVATVLVKRGTLRPSQHLVAGTSMCRVRAILDESGKALTSAGPSTPVQVHGWRELPAAGDLTLEVQDGDGRKAEDLAKRVVEARKERKKREEGWKMVEQMNEARAKRRKEREIEKAVKKKKGKQVVGGTMEEEPEELVLPIVVKADVHGSVEAILGVIDSLPQSEVQVKVISSGVGPVTEEEIRQASVDGGVVLAFNLKPSVPPRIMHLALSEGVRVRQHTIIYQLIDDMKDLLSELLPPEIRVDILGEANVLERFEITVKGKADEAVAGSKVEAGKITKNGLFRIMRNGVELWEGHLKSLKHFKKDVTEITKGNECGISFDGFAGFEPGDVIQSIVKTEIKRHL
ncbi:hypothetical protein HDU93_002636 [Gonapodya sp. JEL0774]|nr:hypothetical protein HDU93_002636 [Gonapodya sp. JEL0774]